MKKRVYVFFASFFALSASAQDLAGGIDAATNELTSVFQPIKTLMYVLCAIVAIFGAVRVYTKHQNGDSDTQKAMGQWGMAFVFLIAAIFIIESVFGV